MSQSKEFKILMEKLLRENPKVMNGQLLTEQTFKPCETILENVNGVQRYYIQGIFSEFNVKNQNGRIYPEAIMKPEVIRYFEKYVKENRALGELNHPDSNQINLDNVSHRIVNLWIEGNNVYGKALIGGPKGDSVKKILDIGGRVGISSRSLGNLNHRNEVSEIQIITWDIVHEPSVASAMMETLTESKKSNINYNWLNDNSGFVTENLKKELKIINNNMLLSEEEKSEFAKAYITEFFNSLYRM
jgi:hypothetical protein